MEFKWVARPPPSVPSDLGTLEDVDLHILIVGRQNPPIRRALSSNRTSKRRPQRLEALEVQIGHEIRLRVAGRRSNRPPADLVALQTRQPLRQRNMHIEVMRIEGRGIRRRSIDHHHTTSSSHAIHVGLQLSRRVINSRGRGKSSDQRAGLRIDARVKILVEDAAILDGTGPQHAFVLIAGLLQHPV